MKPKIYYESKKVMYVTVLSLLVILLVLFFINSLPLSTFFGYLTLIVCVMLIGVYLYPTARISIFEDHLEFKKGRQNISVPWNKVVNIHKDPVFASNIASYYLAKRFYMGGCFIETTDGYTKYFTPQLIRAVGSDQTWKDLVNEIKGKCGAQVKVGEVSMFKQKSKLFDVVFIILSIFIFPVVIILLYGIFTGKFADSVATIKGLFSLLIGK